nr:hypothetical protein [uncultured Desulfobacter sp.]
MLKPEKVAKQLITDKKVAILIPSYGRYGELFQMLSQLQLSENMKVIVSANYPDDKLEHLTTTFSEIAIFIDEKRYGKNGNGCVNALNLGYFLAREMRFDYVLGIADDMIPEDSDWNHKLNQILNEYDIDLGIFSVDECHSGVFGWNFFGGYPCAHLFIAKIDILGDYCFNPSLFMYLADNEIGIRMVRKKANIYLLPIRILHHHKVDPTRIENSQYYQVDVNIFNAIYPDLRGMLDDVVLKGDYRTNGNFILDAGEVVTSEQFASRFISYDEMISCKNN